jgi:CBS domain-containing protein
MMQSVGAMMSEHVVTARATDAVAALRASMRDHDISAVPVVDDDGGLVGVVTSSDLVTADGTEDGVESIMARPVVTVAPSTDVGAAAALMRARRIHHLPVVDEAGALVGIVSSWDLLDDLVETVLTLTAGGVDRPPVEVGDQVTERPVGGTGPTRRGAVLEVHGADGEPPWIVAWDDGEEDGHELAVVKRDEFVLDGCER